MINFSDIFTNNYILNLFPVNIQNYVEEYMLRNYYIVLIFVTRNFWNQKCRLIWIVRSYVAASKKRAAKSRVIVGEWPFRMVTIENTPPILSVGTGRAKGCVNNVRLSTFIREIWRENFVNETRTNKRFAQKRPAIPLAWKFRLQIPSWYVFIAITITLTILHLLTYLRRYRLHAATSDLLIHYFDII